MIMVKGERRQALLENLIYLIIWLTIFVAPMLDYWYNNDDNVQWNDVFRAWKFILPFFVLFVINNYVLIPLLLIRERYWPYFLLAVTVIVLMLLFNPLRMNGPNPGNRPFPERRMEANRPPDDRQRQMPPPNAENFPPKDRQPGDHPFPMDRRPEDMRFHMLRIPFVMPYVNFALLAIFVLGLNIAIKLLFKSLKDDRRMKELEKHTLQTELEYLKHQINPHFFMNTLNNIHALIDIDTERAKDTVLELSKMMRYILYDAALPALPLKNEIRFLTNYVELMRIRYTEQVDIRFSVPEDIPDTQIPPLLFISFIENAFKHGISYKHKSFIHIEIDIHENELKCFVINSYFDNAANDEQRGIGLENVRKRLNLLYGDSYRLTIQQENNEYSVLLIIPIQV